MADQFSPHQYRHQGVSTIAILDSEPVLPPGAVRVPAARLHLVVIAERTKPASLFRRAEGAGIAAIVSPISVQGLTLWQPETMGCSPYCSERMYCCNRSYYAHYCKKIG